ncbi:MAG: hypothetical protein JW934_05680 [Anaerolineae bacterium]|nr:hypothetical protein [Anaerolineae bacterium]
MRLIRLIHNGQAAVVRDGRGRDRLVRQAKIVLRRMKHYLARVLVGVLDGDGGTVQIVLERVKGVVERLRDVLGVVLPPVFGLRVRFHDQFEFCLVWAQKGKE